MAAESATDPDDGAHAVHTGEDSLAEDPVFAFHRGGKMRIESNVPLSDAADLSLAYTPGVARVCAEIVARPEAVREYTWVPRVVAVITDGTAVLGLGDIGPSAAMPVMEGKAVLFKEFGGVDAIPICLDCTDTDELVDTIARLAPSFGGINLEDISAPRCFEVERRLKERLDIPVFHDDQHGTAIVVLAALRNALLVVEKDMTDVHIVIAGAGAAGVAVARILLAAGARNLAVVDRGGIISRDRTDLNDVKLRLAQVTNKAGETGPLAHALKGADVFIGVSGGSVPESVVAEMADDAIIFALANPDPEVDPDIAHRHARVVATGRSDYPNQINNVLAFPGIFRGTFDAGARQITEEMKLAAALALADLVASDLDPTAVIPSPFDRRVAPAVAAAVAAAAPR
jgi:malate dehydrogenase (oxaloacetate-decarboxylating)